MSEVKKYPGELVFGLDIGTRSIVGTVGYQNASGDFIVVAQTTRMHTTRAMLDGQIHDINAVSATIKSVKEELEEQVGRKLEGVCIAAAGRVLKTINATAQMEFAQETVITKEHIKALEMAGVEKAYKLIKEETEDTDMTFYCVAYTVVHYYMGNYQMLTLLDHKCSRIKVEVLATFLPDDVIDGLYAAVNKAGLQVVNLTLEPIAAINVAIPEKFRLLNIALVDVGAGTSDISVTKDGSIIAYGMIPMAGDAVTEAIVERYLVDFNTAEKLKMDACTGHKIVSYKDIIGITQRISPADVIKEVAPVVIEIAQKVAERIKELNSDKSVSAVFVVGGGGKVPGFTKAVAKYLDIAPERVVLRGEEVLADVTFLQDIRKAPELVTPIGICLNYYEAKNNFVLVNVNGEFVKVYDNSHLTIVDAAMQIGFPKEKLFPRRGKELIFTLDGSRRMVRGELGEAAKITLNGAEAGMNTPIKPNDEISITESTAGKPASCEIRRLAEYKGTINVTVNGQKVTCPKFASANGELVPGTYEIQEGDVISILDYYTVEQIFDYLDMPRVGNVYVNNVPAFDDEKVYDNFTMDCIIEDSVNYFSNISENYIEKDKKEVDKSVDDAIINNNEKNIQKEIEIKVNDMPVVLNGKSSYIFVNILDFYPFDVNNINGKEVIMRINGEKAQFTDPVEQGDIIDLYWS